MNLNDINYQFFMLLHNKMWVFPSNGMCLCSILLGVPDTYDFLGCRNKISQPSIAFLSAQLFPS